ncbi:MAG: FkbM family methyltransferase [Flavobacteriales bacterium]|nr:FkbM family methyltransferase [Flavobacteriales bacterium]MCX7767446.1 FkbM family methyltransferase [Flavobacteriales bacterium]MDW8410040.1 FkbM family methyltransferase [Flavobacteriales bacterium]
MPAFKGIPLTRIKIFLARLLYRLVRLWVGRDRVVVTRQGIRYSLDLREGIDLSVFLFGTFQRHVFRNRLFQWKEDAVVLDVGGNAGFMALQFAMRCPRGRVYSFEPTHYGVRRFRENLALNPLLQSRIELIQAFVAEANSNQPTIKAFASWPLAGNPAGESGPIHAVHLGQALDTQGVPSITLDSWAEKHNFSRVDFIKIDTDGHEWRVLQGARKLIQSFKPVVIFEVGQYVMEEHGIGFDHYLKYFESQGYTLYNSATGKQLTRRNWAQVVPHLGTIDVLAMPDRSSSDV